MPDVRIWEYAKQHGFVFLTKDKDFANLSLASGASPKVILLHAGNCSTDRILSILRNNAIRVTDFEQDVRRGLLILR
jgi:predicted nuclease of predicted toxin-antitoxin system